MLYESYIMMHRNYFQFSTHASTQAILYVGFFILTLIFILTPVKYPLNFSTFSHWIKKTWNVLAHLLIHMKFCREMLAYAKIEDLIFDYQFPGNWFELGIIGNNFWISTMWAIQILV